jgi:hypothetical protein
MVVAKFNKHQMSSSHKHANSLWLNPRKNYQDDKEVNKQHLGGASDRRWEAIS